MMSKFNDYLIPIGEVYDEIDKGKIRLMNG